MDIRINKLPKAGLLLFSSKYSKKDSKIKYIFRIATQIFTFSNYDHCGTLIQCPVALNGCNITDFNDLPIVNNGIREVWKGGQYYVFEALHGKGNIVNTIEDFLDGIQNPIIKRTVQLDLQQYIKINDDGTFDTHNINKDFTKMFLNLASQLGKPYTTAWAGYSAFDKTRCIKFLRKKFNIKPSLSKANFCSVYAELGIQYQFDDIINKEEALTMTPEEVRIKNIMVRKFPMAKPFIEIRDGKCVIANSDYFTIQ